MQTSAVDTASIFGSLYRFADKNIGAQTDWHTTSDIQRIVFNLHKLYREEVLDVNGYKALVSDSCDALNELLTRAQRNAVFTQELVYLGIASILDAIIRLQCPVIPCKIDGEQPEQYWGIEVPPEGFQAYIWDESRIVASFPISTGDYLWLTRSGDTPQTLADLVRIAFQTANRRLKPIKTYTSAQVPIVAFSVKGDVPFFEGAYPDGDGNNRRRIQRVYQEISLTFEPGEMAPELTDRSNPLVFNKPFYGWLTQMKAPSVPTTIFFSNTDSWK